MKKVKILTVFGTRPEVIKLSPFIKAVEADQDCISISCGTTQHRELQNDFLNLFKIKTNYDLEIMKKGQDLFHITESILQRIKIILETERPDFTVVQGDTTTAFAAALSSFYCQIPVVHVEAGLRTGDIYSPFPEEANRSLISKLASLHMAPTQISVKNLAMEGITQNVFNVGNTIVDTVQWILKNAPSPTPLIKDLLRSKQKKVLITVHRRENFGGPLKEICSAITTLSKKYPDTLFIWPVHPNPNIQGYVNNHMSKIPNLKLLAPLSYDELIGLLNSSSLILSDSGGIQEEACILGKNIIVLRKETERPEVIQSGFGVLSGADQEKILSCFDEFINSSTQEIKQKNIYGEPGSSVRILSHIKNFLR